MEGLGFGESAIFNGDAEFVYDFGGGDLLVVDGSFEFRVQVVILGGVFINLLNGVEASDGGYKLLSGDLVVSVEVDEVDPFSNLEVSLLW